MRRRSRAYQFPWVGDRSALVAAEDAHTRSYVKEALARSGYTASLCGDIRIVLEREKTAGHSFLILKHEDTGMDVVRSLRKQGTRIPVILLSGSTLEPSAPLDPEVGIVERLSTPFTLETLQLAIAKVCQNESPRSGPSPRQR